MVIDRKNVDFGRLATVIAHSQIMIGDWLGADLRFEAADFPAGYEDVDLAVLAWIVRERERLHPRIRPH